MQELFSAQDVYMIAMHNVDCNAKYRLVLIALCVPRIDEGSTANVHEYPVHLLWCQSIDKWW